MTQQNGHTPGLRASLNSGRIYEADFGPCVAQVYFVEDRPPSEYSTRLNLFTAAPALLEALEAICGAIRARDYGDAALIARNAGRDAIALAKGGAG